MLVTFQRPAAMCAMHAVRTAVTLGAMHSLRRPLASALLSSASSSSSIRSSSTALSLSSSCPAGARGFLTVVPQATVAYRQFLGGYRRRLEPGLHLCLPVFHSVAHVDMREGRIDMENLSAVSKDNIMVWITGTLFYNVRDAEKACFGVQDYVGAVGKVGTSAIRSIIGCKEYDSINSERNEVNAALAKTIASSIDQWGVECTRFEIQAITPQSKEVAKQLELQMEAERLKRKNVLDTEAQVKTSEGAKQSAILVSEGELQSRRNQSEGDLIVEQRRADARQYAIDTETAAMTRQIKTISAALGDDKALTVQFLIEQQKLKHMQAMAANARSTQTYVVPEGGNMFASSKVVSDMLAGKAPGTAGTTAHTQH